jgi:hypothetical protein
MRKFRLGPSIAPSAASMWWLTGLADLRYPQAGRRWHLPLRAMMVLRTACVGSINGGQVLLVTSETYSAERKCTLQSQRDTDAFPAPPRGR